MRLYTPRELFWAARARQREAWDHTSALLAMIGSPYSKKPLRPEMFTPFRDGRRQRPRGPVNSQGIPIVHIQKLEALLQSLPKPVPQPEETANASAC